MTIEEKASPKTTGRPADNTLAKREYVARYRETTNTALYPFGHGLTYGAVTYAAPMLSAPGLAWGGEIEASVGRSTCGSRPRPKRTNRCGSRSIAELKNAAHPGEIRDPVLWAIKPSRRNSTPVPCILA